MGFSHIGFHLELGGNWRAGEWPSQIEVRHECAPYETKVYEPPRSAEDRSDMAPWYGVWCSNCGWAGYVREDKADMEKFDSPQFNVFSLSVPEYCPHCGRRLIPRSSDSYQPYANSSLIRKRVP